MAKKNLQLRGVRAASTTSIEIDFYLGGVRCKERIKKKPTNANLQWAQRFKEVIDAEIRDGSFDYAKRFPNSKRRKVLANDKATVTSVEDTLTRWLSVIESEVQHPTFEDYKKSVTNILIPEFGEMMLSDLKTSAIREWVNGRFKTIKRASNVLRPLRGALELAVDDELIPASPIAGYKIKFKEEIKEDDDIDPFTPEEIATILENCATSQERNLYEFVVWTGVRTSELLALKWGDVDWLNGLIRIKRAIVRKKKKAPKTKSGRREIKLLPPALKALKRQKEFTFLAGDAIFHNPRTNEPWETDAQIRKTAWSHTLRRACVRYRYPYQLRHTYCSWQLSAGENPMWIAGQMGHTDTRMIFSRYGRWIPSSNPAAGEKALEMYERTKNG